MRNHLGRTLTPGVITQLNKLIRHQIYVNQSVDYFILAGIVIRTVLPSAKFLIIRELGDRSSGEVRDHHLFILVSIVHVLSDFCCDDLDKQYDGCKS